MKKIREARNYLRFEFIVIIIVIVLIIITAYEISESSKRM